MFKNILSKGLNLTIAIAFVINIFAPTPPANADTLRAVSLGNAPNSATEPLLAKLKNSSAGQVFLTNRLYHLIPGAKDALARKEYIVVNPLLAQPQEQTKDTIFVTPEGLARLLAPLYREADRLLSDQIKTGKITLEKAISKRWKELLEISKELRRIGAIGPDYKYAPLAYEPMEDVYNPESDVPGTKPLPFNYQLGESRKRDERRGAARATAMVGHINDAYILGDIPKIGDVLADVDKSRPEEIITTQMVQMIMTHETAVFGKEKKLWIITNLFPIIKNHFMIVDTENIRQQLPLDFLRASLEIIAQLPNMTVSYNSRGAKSSVNHPHFQGYPTFPSPLDDVKTTDIIARFGNLGIRKLGGGNNPVFPATGFVIDFDTKPKTLDDLARLLHIFVQDMMVRDMPHTLIFRNNRLFIFPRKPLPIGEIGQSYAGFEYGGFILMTASELINTPYAKKQGINLEKLNGMKAQDDKTEFNKFIKKAFMSVRVEDLVGGFKRLNLGDDKLDELEKDIRDLPELFANRVHISTLKQSKSNPYVALCLAKALPGISRSFLNVIDLILERHMISTWIKEESLADYPKGIFDKVISELQFYSSDKEIIEASTLSKAEKELLKAMLPSKSASAGFRDKNEKLVEDILDTTKPYYGYDIILIVTTEKEEREAMQRDFDAVFGAGRRNKENGSATVIAVNIDISDRGQLIDAGYGLQKAIDEMKEEMDLLKELNDGKTICAILDAGAGKRGGNLTLSENGSRGAVHIGGKLKNGISMTTLIKGTATSALFARSGRGYMDVFYTASQAVIPDADVTEETEPGNVKGCIIKFAQDVNDASQVTQKTVENFGVYEIDGATDKVTSRPKWTWCRQDETKPFAKTNVSVEKGLENFEAARKKGNRWGFSLGSHRVNIEFELALLEFLKETNRFNDKECPKLEPPALILPVLTYRELAEQNPGQPVNRADVLKNIKGDISPKSAELALDFYEWYIKKHGEPEHFLGLSGIGSDLYWWVYRESFGILNNSLLMLSDLSGKKIQVDNQGAKHEEYAKPEDKKEARVLRELHNITAPIMRCTLGGIYVDEEGKYTEDGQGKQVTFADMKNGVTIGGVKVRNSILLDSNICKGSEVNDSFVEDTTATEKLLVNYAYVARSNVSYAQARGALLYNVIGRLDEEVVGVSCVDVFREGLRGDLRDERFPEGQTRLFQRFDADPNKQFGKPYPTPLPGNRFSYQEIADLNVAGATEIRNRIASLFTPKSSSAGTCKGAIFDLDGVITSTATIHFQEWKKLFEGDFAKQRTDGLSAYDHYLSMLQYSDLQEKDEKEKQYTCIAECKHHIDKEKNPEEYATLTLEQKKIMDDIKTVIDENINIGREFTHDDYLTYVDGIGRYKGCLTMFKAAGAKWLECLKEFKDHHSKKQKKYALLKAEEQQAMDLIKLLGDYKDALVKKHLNEHPEDVQILRGGIELLLNLKKRGIKLAVASSSKNTPRVLEIIFEREKARFGTSDYTKFFDVTITGYDLNRYSKHLDKHLESKPASDIFEEAAYKMGFEPEECVGFEDALQGVQAVRAAGIPCVGIAPEGKHMLDKYSDLVVPDLTHINYDKMQELVTSKSSSAGTLFGADLKGVIFDLDGVVTKGSEELHFRTWKKVLEQEFRKNKDKYGRGRRFTYNDYLEKVSGRPALEAVKDILIHHTKEELPGVCDRKKVYYRELVESEGLDVYLSTIRFVNRLKEKGILVGLGSSNTQAKLILNKLGLNGLFGVVVDISQIPGGTKADIFRLVAMRLGLSPQECIVVEDAKVGVEAAKEAGMHCIAVDRVNRPDLLKEADRIVKDLEEVDIDEIKDIFKQSPLAAKSSSRGTLKGVVFDLDGVITSTERIHFINWKKMFDEEFKRHPETAGREFTYQDYLEHVDGIPRYDGCLVMFLAAKVQEFECLRGVGRFVDKTKKEQSADYEKLTPEQKRAMERIRELGDRKNKWFNEYLLAHREEIEILPGALELLRALRVAGIRRIGVASSSKNTPTVLKLTGLSDKFDIVISGHDIGEWSELQGKVIEGKPKPDIFIEAAMRMSIKPSECVGLEDALKGVQAIQAAGMPCVGIGPKKLKPEEEQKFREFSNIVIKNLTEIDVKKMRDLVTSKSSSAGAIKGAIFDVEGVIMSTSKIRYLSWKDILEGEFNSHPETRGREFTVEDYDKIMNGLAAADACLAVLVAYEIEEFKCLKGIEHFIDKTANPEEFEKLDSPQKEAMEEIRRLTEAYEAEFSEYINDHPEYIEVLPGIERFLYALNARGIRLGVVSSGRGIRSILTLVGLEDMFEVFVSGDDIGEWSVVQHRVLRPKPYPDMYIEATLRMNLEPVQCIGFEDTKSGAQAIKTAEMVSVGVDMENTGKLAEVADITINDFASVDINAIEKLVASKSSSAGERQLAEELLDYAPKGDISTGLENQAVIVYSDALIQSKALQKIISTYERGTRRFYLVNKEDITNDKLFASLEVKGITKDNFDHIFVEQDPERIVSKITPVLIHNSISQVRVFALSEEDVTAWSRQKMVDALIMLLKTKEFIIVSPDEWRQQLYEKDMQRHEVLSQV